MNELQRVGQELAEKRKAAHEMYELKESGKEFTADDVETFANLRKEIDELGVKHLELKQIDAAAQEDKKWLDDYNRPSPSFPPATGGMPGDVPMQLKTAGELFTDSDVYQKTVPGKPKDVKAPDFAFEIGRFANDPIELKTTIVNAAYVPPNFRGPMVVPAALQRPLLANHVPSYNTENQITKWMKETTTTQNVAAVAENAAATESALAWTEQTATLQKVTGFISVTDEQLQDVPNLQSLINDRLMTFLAYQEDYYLFQGTGTPPQIGGFNATAHSGFQTQAKGTDPAPDAFYKAITKIRAAIASGIVLAGGTEPDLICMHPTDWQNIQTLRTSDGLYIWGNPASATGSPTMWGLPVLVTINIGSAGTALVGDFAGYSRIARRQGATMDMTNAHASQFTSNVYTIKITSRLTLEVYREGAYATVTGL